jgi:protein subunit release factor B
MRALGVREEDLEEQFVRSSGPGGQNVNKVATCVVLRHRPTALSVKCQDRRTQAENRLTARAWLCDKIEERRERREAARKALKEKIRRQKRPRPRALQEKILEQKKQRSLKKESRRRIPARRVTLDD